MRKSGFKGLTGALLAGSFLLAVPGTALAASVVTLVPAVFVFAAGQDYLEKGIVAAGVKG